VTGRGEGAAVRLRCGTSFAILKRIFQGEQGRKGFHEKYMRSLKVGILLQNFLGRLELYGQCCT
jgi:hypothetical protein